MLFAGLLAAQQAGADVSALLACRHLQPGQGRAECLERESARLEQEMAVSRPEVRPAAAAPAIGPVPPPALVAAPVGIGVVAVNYVDGRPLFTLVGGERWQAREERRLTLHPGRDMATLERTPAGMVLHFNRSFFGLHVSRLP